MSFSQGSFRIVHDKGMIETANGDLERALDENLAPVVTLLDNLLQGCAIKITGVTSRDTGLEVCFSFQYFPFFQQQHGCATLHICPSDTVDFGLKIDMPANGNGIGINQHWQSDVSLQEVLQKAYDDLKLQYTPISTVTIYVSAAAA